MARITYVQDRETGELIEKGEWLERQAAKGQAPLVMGDIDPYISTIDGSIIGSRSTHRRHLAQHGKVEIGTEDINRARTYFDRPPESKQEKRQRLDAVIAACEKHGLH